MTDLNLEPTPRKRTKLPVVLGAIAAVVLLSLGIVIGAAIAAPEEQESSAAERPVNKNNSTPFVLPSTTVPTAAPTTEATTTEPTTEPVATKSQKPSYKKLTAREWKKIAKSPDEYIGKYYVVYGVVTQFDSATGDATFRANVDGINHTESYDYDTNTILDGDADILADLVEDDHFRAKVMVFGSYSYDTQAGGSTTAPQLSVQSIEVL